MFTLWYSVLSWREYRDTLSNKACPKTDDTPSCPPKVQPAAAAVKSNDAPKSKSTAPSSPAPSFTPAPVNKPTVTAPKTEPVAPPKVSSPLPVPAKPAPRSPTTPPQKPPASQPVSFEKLEQLQENRARGGASAPAPASNFTQKTQPPRSPLPPQKVDNARATMNFIKRENSYSSEEEGDEDDEEEEDDSEIERIDLHSK